MGIYANPPMVTKYGDSVNICFEKAGRIISICCDNSCGTMLKLARSDLVLLVKEDSGKVEDHTDKIFEEDTVPANIESFQKAWEWLNNTATDE